MELYFETFGCTANQNSSEIMKGLVKQAGLNLTTSPDFADIIIINSCIVKQPTISKIHRKISDFLKQDKKIILAGCMPRLAKEELQDPNLYLLDTTHIKDIVNLIKDIQYATYESDKYLELRKESKTNLPKISNSKIIGITQISEGCQGNCSYCITRLAKGPLFSYSPEDILKSVESDVKAGCKEICLTSQDNAAYENDRNKYSLPELLNKILNIPGRFYIRLGMMNPDNVLSILDELIKIYKHPKMFKFLHIPIQSGSDKILKSMSRKYKIKDVLKIIDKFKKEIPEITLSTDIIVGFPGETDKDFKQTIDLIKQIKPEILNRSNFSAHKGTSAFNLKQLPEKTLTKRAKQLMDLHLDICKNLNNSFVGKEIKVLIDKKGWENTWLGRSENYKLVAVHSDKNLLGKIIKAKIEKAMPHYLTAEVV